MCASFSQPAAGEASRSNEVVRLWLRLTACERSIEQRLRSHLTENFDVTLPQFEVLCELDRRGKPVAMSQLSNRLNVTSSNLTGVVDRLVRKGLVRRFRSKKDRRVQHIEMTPEGRTVHADIAADNALWIARAFTNLTDEEVVQLRKLLRQASLSAAEGVGLTANV
jgi:DNA-binding MarR family transcriptional regulator